MKKENKSLKINDEKIIAIIFIGTIFSLLIFTIIHNFSSIKDKLDLIWNQEGISKYEKIVKMADQSETILNEFIYQKSNFINYYGLIQKVLQKNYIEDNNDKKREIYKTKEGMITFIQDKEDMETRAKNIHYFQENLEKENIPFIYVQAPYKVRKVEDLPIGVKDYSNENANILLECLKQQKVETIDLREKFKDMDIREEYFITDHHWKITTAFQAVNEISMIANKQYGFNIDSYYFDSNNYKIINKPKSFLGSVGKRVGKYYTTVDDFEYMLPDFKTDYEVTKNEQTQKGNFEETIIVKELIENSDITTNRYAAYFGGDYPEIILKNKTALEDKKVLVIQDSYGLAFSALLSLRVKELRTIDLRHFEKDEISYCKEYAPDLVIMLYNPSSFYIEKNFQF